MAGVALADQVARVTRELWRLNLSIGFKSRMGWDAGKLGHLAKAAGATESQVTAWLAGEVEPTPGQMSAILDALPLPVTGAAAMNGATA